MKDILTAQMVTDALMRAIRRRGRPKALMHHSDQASQYSSEALEGFFSSLKTERKSSATLPDAGLRQPDAVYFQASSISSARADRRLGSHKRKIPESTRLGAIMIVNASCQPQ